MSDVVTEKQKAFARLAEVVQRLTEQERKTRSAALKPMLQALYLSEGGFDEHSLGFASFRAFVQAASDDGHVSVRRAAQGPDVDVLPAGATTAARPVLTRLEHIRGDLWDAFVDWRQEWTRVYDRETDQVGWLTAQERQGEDGAAAALRRAITDNPGRYVAITPIGQDAVLRWMRDFEAGLAEESQRTIVNAALSNPTPIRAFVLATRATGLHELWKETRLEKVQRHIEGWAAEHKLEIDLSAEHEPFTAKGMRAATSERRRSQENQLPSVDELRDLVCKAVKKMSRGELLRLAIPLEYVVGEDEG